MAIRRADQELSPVNLALLRWFVASAGFLAIFPFLGKAKTRFEARKDLPRLLVVALNNVVIYHIFLNYAETSVSAGLAGLLISLGPIFIAVLSALLLKERIGRNLAIALAVALAGAAILAIPILVLRPRYWVPLVLLLLRLHMPYSQCSQSRWSTNTELHP